VFLMGCFGPFIVKTLSLLESEVIAKWLQRECLKAKTDSKWRQECQGFPVFHLGPSKESVLFSKSSLGAPYITRIVALV
jgi:hypothetical protein